MGSTSHRTQTRGLVIGVLSASALFTTRPANAQTFTCPSPSGTASADERLARSMYDSAFAREAADPEGALTRYRCAASIVDRPAIALRRGALAERIGLVDEAIEAFEHYLTLAGADAPDAPEMRAHVARLRQRKVAAVEPPPVEKKPAAATNTDPGASRDADAHGAATWRTVGIVGTAVGAALLAAGGVFLVLAKSANDDARDVPAGTPWESDDARGSYDAARRNQTIGIIGLVSGAVVAGAGLVLWSTAGAKVSTTASTTSAGLRLEGTF